MNPTPDTMHNVLKTIDHNRWTAVGILLAALLAAALAGCQIRTPSLLTPGQKVTPVELTRETALADAGFATRRAELEAAAAALNADIAAFNAQAETAQADLQRQIDLRTRIVETVGSLGLAAAEGTFSPAAGIGAMVQLLTLGAAGGLLADNRRKDRVIGDAKAKEAA
jgi:predicted small lipoprotein YifL